jgi:flagellar hook-basal body complex protein FliE
MIEAISQNATLGQAKPVFPTAGNASSIAHSAADFASHMAASIKGGEIAAMAGLNGALPMQQVVEKVLEADRAVTTLVSVRDKAVGAILELSRMQV